MRTASLIKVMVGCFLAPAAVGSAAYYFVRPMMSTTSSAQDQATEETDQSEAASKRFTAPKVTISSHRATIRKGGSVVGRRPRPRKVEKKEAPAETAGATTTMGPDGGGAASPPPITSAPDTGSGPGMGLDGG